MTTQQKQRLTYGRAECSTATKGQTDHAKHVHLARLAQLEQAIPGITAPGSPIAISTVGVSAKGDLVKLARDCSNASEIVNDPYTWVETPGGQYTIGSMSSDQVKVNLAACGYAFSGKPNMAWMTDGKGMPAKRFTRRRGVFDKVRDDE
jgi:hypothetical protein